MATTKDQSKAGIRTRRRGQQMGTAGKPDQNRKEMSKTPALQAFGFTMLIGTTVVWLIVPCFDNHPVEKEEATAGS